eukprot:CAMPEP_0202841500 /NCGR_PEP_ID=MMETSP1389-20130828/58729_1 /ASSEMBLY_ACC=CAM_ASM_000865 /TAXON_ID=302021 /ORGANISM="Rhodomonas sp., Strain CCMP768" /LENGTH=418 /DNA_ID=CAMNT_0049518313 /DNA_START=94 /DNA_END=1346 /DNA_ORIENTATION=-
MTLPPDSKYESESEVLRSPTNGAAADVSVLPQGGPGPPKNTTSRWGIEVRLDPEEWRKLPRKRGNGRSKPISSDDILEEDSSFRPLHSELGSDMTSPPIHEHAPSFVEISHQSQPENGSNWDEAGSEFEAARPGGGQCPFSAISAGFARHGADSPPPRSPLTKRLTREVSESASVSSRGSAAQTRIGGAPSRRSAANSVRRRGGKGKGRKGRPQRARRVPQYSEWEANTYIPMLKDSWARVLGVTTPQSLGSAIFVNLAADVEDYYADISVQEFMDMLAQIVEVAEDYLAVFETMKSVLAKPLAAKCATADHLQRDLGQNLILAMQARLGSGFSSMDKGAWEFFFTWLGSALEFALDQETGVTPSVLRCPRTRQKRSVCVVVWTASGSERRGGVRCRDRCGAQCLVACAGVHGGLTRG